MANQIATVNIIPTEWTFVIGLYLGLDPGRYFGREPPRMLSKFTVIEKHLLLWQKLWSRHLLFLCMVIYEVANVISKSIVQSDLYVLYASTKLKQAGSRL